MTFKNESKKQKASHVVCKFFNVLSIALTSQLGAFFDSVL
jgi:hypothetical protein